MSSEGAPADGLPDPATAGSETPTDRDADRAATRPGRRLRLYSILIGLALSGVVFLAYSQTWFSLDVSSPQGGDSTVTVAGSAAGAALSALALAGLALFCAITIAGRVFRVILGALEVVLGGCVVLAAGLGIGDPVKASETSITNVTGVSGTASVRALVQSHSMTAWPIVAVAAGVAMAVLGVAVVVTSRRWPTGSQRRYQAIRVVDAAAPTDPVVAWDTLSTGADPTAEPGDNR
ncbi:Trp biosynthesis-associated membrane protein [Frondihabitans australicus]|uniref:Putative membrane protein (TIGR02234 family) n=1 Tax=Frondihabitans australicus TaxID=386892 RepID=A0A495IDP8_9MICO|nr:Trp biosynthesis-associated membrane protein [Frondihabitans australicus]RKR74123.1 putative membrane protein (TIGR02234 family) [Frondihabitans australicus]